MNLNRKRFFLIVLLLWQIGILASAAPLSKAERFGVLTFLDWNDPWNHYMYSRKKALKAIALIEKCGIRWVRQDFTWRRIEPERNQYHYEECDWIVEELTKRGISILGVLGYAPEWAALNPSKWTSPPRSVDEFQNYVQKTVARYKGKINHWEIWNEPNTPLFWEPQDNLRTYAQLLRQSYAAVKEANPQAMVLHGGLTGDVDQGVKRLYELGLKDFFDAVNLHFIIDPLIPDAEWNITGSVDAIQKTMAQFGNQEKPIWITELGCAGFARTEKDQALFLTRAFTALTQQNKVDKIFWAFLQDTNRHFHNNIDSLGLLRQNLTPKPAYKAYHQFLSKE